MKISHEAPITLLPDSRTFNDYDYALVHLFEEHEDYYNFFKESIDMGREVILDNSIFELGEAFDQQKYVEYILELNPTYFIIPDVLEDCDGTISNAEQFLVDYNLSQKSIGVVQGKTYEEIVKCYQYMDKIGVDKIAISFDYSLYEEMNPHLTNKWFKFSVGRPQLLGRMLKEGIINTEKKHHLLGCALPFEFAFYRSEEYSWLDSLDTSSPVVHGLLDIPYEPFGIIEKDSLKLADLIRANPNKKQTDIIQHNLLLFKTYVSGLV